MAQFTYIDDVEDWLAPMDYDGFWYAVAPYNLVLQDKDHCDRQIEEGIVEQALVLDVLKSMARIELTQILKLHRKMPTPWVQLAIDND
jgi:hypothetical protein